MERKDTNVKMKSRKKITLKKALFYMDLERHLTVVFIMAMIGVVAVINNHFNTPEDVLTREAINVSSKYDISNAYIYSGDGTVIEEIEGPNIQYAHTKLEGIEYTRISDDETHANINEYTAIMCSPKVNEATLTTEHNVATTTQKVVVSTIEGTPIATYYGADVIYNTNKVYGATFVSIDDRNYIFVNANVSVFTERS